MKEAKTNNKYEKIFGLFLTLVIAFGGGVSVTPKHVIKSEAAVAPTSLITDPSNIVSGASYHLVRHDGAYYVETSTTGDQLAGTAVTGTTIEGLGFLFVKDGSFWSIKNNETGKYLIHATNGDTGTNVAYVYNVGSHWNISTGSGLKFAAVNNNSVENRGMLWNKTKIGGYSLTNQTAGNYYRIALLEVQSIDTSYDDAQEFATWLMDPLRNNEECANKFADALVLWNALSQEAKDLFNTHEDFVLAHARLVNWAIANESLGVLSGNTIVEEKTINKSNDKSKTSAIIIGVIGVTTLIGYYFLQKKKHA